MENSVKQSRVKFSCLGEESQEDEYNNIKGRMPPKKTVSFKGERRKAGRFQRPLSAQTSDADTSSDGEIEAAIAAAAYAIAYMEDSGSSPDKKDHTERVGRTSTKITSKKEEGGMGKPVDTSGISEPTDTGSITKPSDTSSVIKPADTGSITKPTDTSKISTGERSMRKSATFDQSKLEDSTTNAARQIPGNTNGEKTLRKSKSLNQMMLEDSMTTKKLGSTPTIKKTPTFSEKYLNDPGSDRQDMKAEHPEAIWYPRPDKSRKEEEMKADVWEEEQMTKIRKWYEKMNSRILQWENDKKMKAKRQLERKERELQERRARYLQEYRNEISRVDKITSGARAASEERKRTRELKTREMARKLRSRGKVPRKCLCF